MKKKVVIEEKKEILVAVDNLENMYKIFPTKYDNSVVVTHRSIYEIYKSKIKTITKDKIFLPEGEKIKSFKYLVYLYKKFLEKKLTRRSLVIIVGGGVLGDLVGFAAATYMRGVSYIQVPTTLLAMVDSSIGGKTAIDIKEAKNLIGSFYQPKLILCDFAFLSSLPEKEILNGFGEIVKYAIINKRIFEMLSSANKDEIFSVPFPINDLTKKLILECINTKLQIVKEDEKETLGMREKLNLGHTIAHAIEASCGYKYYSHGEAVFLGVLAETYISYKLDILKELEYRKIIELIDKYVEHFKLSKKILMTSVNKIFYHIKFDKKFYKNNYRLVLPLSIGNVKTIDFVPKQLIKESIDFLKKWLRTRLVCFNKS